MKSSSIYRAIVVELERKRLAMGISMDMMSELMGVAERSYAKLVWPDTASGRQASWEKLQRAVDVLFADGFEVVLRAGASLTSTTPGTKRLIRQAAAHYDRRASRELMRELSIKGNEARNAKLPAWKRRAIARKAGRARAKKARERAKPAASIAREAEHRIAAS